MTTRRRTATSAGALVAALAAFTTLVTACGGDARLSAREYVHEASAICRHAAERTDGTTRLGRIAAVQAHAAARLEALHPPESMAGFDAEWVALVRQSAGELEALVVSRRAGERDVAGQQEQAVTLLTTRAAEMARARGITACPRPFTPTETSVDHGSVERGT